MSRLEFTGPARADLQEIQDYIAGDSVEAAERWVGILETECRKLAEMPGLGRRRDELAPDLRSVPVGVYIIVYRQIVDGVQIIRVLHGARDYEGLF
jgi:toxin ParE1/3/4